jgi:CelD/BcsL family acetyltransferase involved in cellulose biosynthesis
MHYWIDPVRDPRWAELVDRHPASSVFHTTEWLTALRRTYGFEPLALTSSPPGTSLADGILFCKVRSLITGTRLVSLPFSDHCQPLSASEDLLCALAETRERERMKYVELRPVEPLPRCGLEPSQRYYLHTLDLCPPLEDVFRKFHADCVRRKIRRAERENLAVEEGRSEDLLRDFFALQVITRRRHGLPPQPVEWFRNILAAMGEKAVIRVARSNGRAVASIMTLRHKQTAVYKYGGSDLDDSNLGGTQLLLWKAIEDARGRGMVELDMGRCDIEAAGLAQFKERWGARRREVTYYRDPAKAHRKMPEFNFLARLPNPVLILVGRLLYRHLA